MSIPTDKKYQTCPNCGGKGSIDFIANGWATTNFLCPCCHGEKTVTKRRIRKWKQK